MCGFNLPVVIRTDLKGLHCIDTTFWVLKYYTIIAKIYIISYISKKLSGNKFSVFKRWYGVSYEKCVSKIHHKKMDVTFVNLWVNSLP